MNRLFPFNMTAVRHLAEEKYSCMVWNAVPGGRLIPGAPSLLAHRKPGDVDFVVGRIAKSILQQSRLPIRLL